jgi:diadenosine tetraphosphatase ApaH/serine/threonine PP2A family protein phosphatase
LVGGVMPLAEFSAAIVSDFLNTAIKFLSTQPSTVIDVPAPCVVVGDIHGNFHNLLGIFARVGDPFANRFLFLGDYVDRGDYSLEVLLCLLVLAMKHPDRFFLLRGNHESRQLNRICGFHDEIMQRFRSDELWQKCLDVYVWLPLAAVVSGRVFCVHGGIGPRIKRVDDICRVKLPVHDDNPIFEILWADPSNVPGFERGERGQLFGPSVLRTFLGKSGLKGMIRGHQEVPNGWKDEFGDMLCVTVHSTADHDGNRGAFLWLSQNGAIQGVDYDQVPFTKRSQAQFVPVALPEPEAAAMAG